MESLGTSLNLIDIQKDKNVQLATYDQLKHFSSTREPAFFIDLCHSL
jgi:hypothetical protein